jgi:hypothetical protein
VEKIFIKSTDNPELPKEKVYGPWKDRKKKERELAEKLCKKINQYESLLLRAEKLSEVVELYMDTSATHTCFDIYFVEDCYMCKLEEKIREALASYRAGEGK